MKNRLKFYSKQKKLNTNHKKSKENDKKANVFIGIFSVIYLEEIHRKIKEEIYFKKGGIQSRTNFFVSSKQLTSDLFIRISSLQMSKRFFEGAQQAARYALTRPTYPKELMEKIINFLTLRVCFLCIEIRVDRCNFAQRFSTKEI